MSKLVKALFPLCGFVGLVVFAWPFLCPPISRSLLQEIDVLLTDYSHALTTGEIMEVSYYSPEMQRLIKNRRWFYAEYVNVSAMSELQNLTAEFFYQPRKDYSVPALVTVLLDSNSFGPRWDALRGRSVAVPVDAQLRVLSDDRFSLRVTEMVTVYAKYSVPPEEYPVVLGARWALERTTDPLVKEELQKYITSSMNEVRPSFEEGYEFATIIYHHMIVQRTSTGLQIIEDTFTDRDTIFPGADNVTWVDGSFVRDTSSFTRTAEYLLYQQSVEEIGKSLLKRYTEGW